MIIRKPYAFLIKNFRKIHIALLLVGIFVFYKTIDIAGFVNDFMSRGTYDFYANPISKHITGLTSFCVLFMVAGSVALLVLLLHKKKPWKAYLVPVITYVALMAVFSIIKGFFGGYTEAVESTNLRFSRDLLVFVMIAQLPSLGIFVMRIFGLDVKKFDFNADLEFLDLSEEDREEIEVSLDIDVNTFKRAWRKFLRNLDYFYREHKFISWAIIVVTVVSLIYNTYTFIFVTHKTYKQGQTYNANGYSFIVNKAYFTDKDVAGNEISKDSNFVIVEITVKNNSQPRILETSNFHLKAGSKKFTTTETTYAKEFEDLGACYSKVKELKRDETATFIIVYKVDKKIRKGKFVLYYQEKGGIFKLRKIKLKTEDISKVDKTQSLKWGEFFDVSIYKLEDSIALEEVKFSNNVDYKQSICTSGKCEPESKIYSAPDGYKVMSLTFATDLYEAKNMIDFLKKYGRINYKDSRGKDKTLDIDIAVRREYLGKTVYLKVPEKFDDSKSAFLTITIRNKSYSYQLV